MTNLVTVTRRIEFDMGHRVPNHKSQCKNLHGHRYVLEATVAGPVVTRQGASDEGMVVDFGDLKAVLMEQVHARFDHGFMMYERDPLAELFRGLTDQKIIFVPFIPTAEEIAAEIFRTTRDKLAERSLTLHAIDLWETPNSRARVVAAD